MKNLGRNMPESIFREELESLNIRVQGVTQLRSGRRHSNHAKDHPSTPKDIVSLARGPEVSKVRSLAEICGLRLSAESYVAPKRPLQCKPASASAKRSVTEVTQHRCVACVGFHLSRGCSTPRGQPQGCGCGGNYTANYRGCVKR